LQKITKFKKNNNNRQTRSGLYLNLVKTGGPGIKLKPEYDRMIKSITLPKLVGEYIKNELVRENKSILQEVSKQFDFIRLELNTKKKQVRLHILEALKKKK